MPTVTVCVYGYMRRSLDVMTKTSGRVDLWLRQPATLLPEALEEGFRNFTWHMPLSLAKKLDPIARTRAYALPYGENCRMMLIDEGGAQEYSLFSRYDEPLAVYPTWTPEEPVEVLEYLCENPPGENPNFYLDQSLDRVFRPVKGQKHRVVIHRIGNGNDSGARHSLLMMLRDLQAEYEHLGLEIFVSGLINYNHLFEYGLLAADYRPACMMENKIYAQITLPTGKKLRELDQCLDPRYADWFELLGFTQMDLVADLKAGSRIWPRFCMRSVQWAKQNWHLVEPFTLDRRRAKPEDVLDNPDVIYKSSTEFVLPGTRRRVMRNLGRLGFKPSELDQFYCDTCILHNSCKLYREGSICTVEGSETVSLAKSFGTRNAQAIIDGLQKLIEKQAERLDDALSAEDNTDPNSDITRQINSLFANGVKLAKLLDPALAGGPKVQVNVGVGAGGSAQIVAQQDPRDLTSRIVAELESRGIPRADITPDMVAGVLKGMGTMQDDPEIKALEAAAANVKPKTRKKKEDSETSSEQGVLVGELVAGQPVTIAPASE